jgi:membrane-associated protein
MQEYFIQLAVQHLYFSYAIVVIFACIEGPVLSMIFGVLIKLGYFSFWPIYAALMAGDLLGDTIWYHVGRYFGYPFIRKFGKYFSIDENSVTKISEVFHKHKYSILFISKITTGFGFAIVTLLTAGIVKIPFKRYLLTNLLGQFIWSGILIGVGFFFSHLYLGVNNVLSRLSIIALFVIIIAAFMGFRKYLRNRIIV